MAGYIFTVDDSIGIEEMIRNGYYSTNIKYKEKIAITPFESTFADYITMKENDNIYFFKDRKIYGVGKLIKIGDDCKYDNYVGASKYKIYTNDEIIDSILVDYGSESPHYRWICFFEASPFFYKIGIDMDDVLQYKPNSFKSLRTFWKRTFIKIDDEENQALRELFILRLSDCKDIINVELNKSEIKSKITVQHKMSYTNLIVTSINGNKLIHEMAVEAATLEKLSLIEEDIFGKWDFITHQISASPFKPVDYMDKIDIFAYRYTELSDCRVISKYMVVELKKDSADCDTIKQITNYVDWICKNYTYGDYSLIEAYILANEFDNEMYLKNDMYERTYNIGSHPIQIRKWNDLKFIKYYIEDNQIKYLDVTKKEE